MYMSQERQIAFRISAVLYQKIESAAEQNGWDVSKQLRAHLERDYGIEQKPYIPQVISSTDTFQAPTHEASERRKRRSHS